MMCREENSSLEKQATSERREIDEKEKQKGGGKKGGKCMQNMMRTLGKKEKELELL